MPFNGRIFTFQRAPWSAHPLDAMAKCDEYTIGRWTGQVRFETHYVFRTPVITPVPPSGSCVQQVVLVHLFDAPATQNAGEDTRAPKSAPPGSAAPSSKSRLRQPQRGALCQPKATTLRPTQPREQESCKVGTNPQSLCPQMPQSVLIRTPTLQQLIARVQLGDAVLAALRDMLLPKLLNGEALLCEEGSVICGRC